MLKQDWVGRVGTVWAEEWRGTERTFAGLEPHLQQAIAAAAPEHGNFLDIGCGVGTTTLGIAAARPDARIAGIDLSAEMIGIAQQRTAEAGALIDFRAGDVVDLLPTDLDLLFSRHGVMFFDDPPAAFAALRRAAKPGASLVFSCFRTPAENPWASDLTRALGVVPPPPGYTPGPFAFADSAFVAPLLAGAGWTPDGAPQPIDYPYIPGEGVHALDEATALLTRIGPAARAIADADPAARSALVAKVRDTLASHQDGDRIAIPAAAWIWTARAGDAA